MSVSLPTVHPTWVTNAKGETLALISQTDLANVRIQGRHLRAYCPIHGSDRQASLSVNMSNGFGTCFCCGVRVLVRELNREVAERLQHASPDLAHLLPLASSRVLSPPSADSCPSWQAKECQILRDLFQSGALLIDRPEAWNAQAYLEVRCIPIELARAMHVGYLEVGASTKWGEKLLQRWEDRILFPLQMPDNPSTRALGFAGRLLTGWQSCVDEEAHQILLEQQDRRRWLKTYPAGWFCTPSTHAISPLIVVEGPFDRLALLAAGFEADEVTALVGTTLRAAQIPASVRSLLLALVLQL